MADDQWPMTDARKPAGKRRIRSFRSVISHFLAISFRDGLLALDGCRGGLFSKPPGGGGQSPEARAPGTGRHVIIRTRPEGAEKGGHAVKPFAHLNRGAKTCHPIIHHERSFDITFIGPKTYRANLKHFRSRYFSRSCPPRPCQMRRSATPSWCSSTRE